MLDPSEQSLIHYLLLTLNSVSYDMCAEKRNGHYEYYVYRNSICTLCFNEEDIAAIYKLGKDYQDLSRLFTNIETAKQNAIIL